ncbi:MAG: VWA domain-containing protein [Acidimicrobiia bacterium]|nr:MAG: VWA domain-containing protein [Acidimicrobiia bacterium]
MTAVGAVASSNLVVFVRSLRANGFSVSTSTTGELVEAGGFVGLADRGDVRSAFRSIVATRQNQVALFDELFDDFFSGDIVISLDDMAEHFARETRTNRSLRVAAEGATTAEVAADTEEVLEVVGGSAAERLADIDFADLSDEEAASVAALLASLTWSPSSYRSRRWKAAPRGAVPDLRRTIRLMTGPSGDLMPLAYSQRRRRQRPLVVMADISGSMERYAEMLLYFVHGAQYMFNRVESFVFSTRLTRITRQLRRRDPIDALGQVARTVPDWSGGTRIGDAIGSFNRDWSRRIGGGAIVLIISDGWDTGEPTHLAREMQRLARTVHRVIWLNPLAGHDGFSPEARGMAAALPHVDDLLAAGTARNLVDLIDLLQTSDSRQRRVVGL